MDYERLFGPAIGALVSGLLGTGLGYFVGKLQESGKINSQHDSMGKLADVSGSNAYAATTNTKEAELHVQTENLQKILANTEQLTRATESIKTELATRSWETQQHWQGKRDAYAQLLEIAYKIWQYYDNALYAFRASQGPQEVPRMEAENFINLRARAMAIAWIFCPAEVHQALEDAQTEYMSGIERLRAEDQLLRGKAAYQKAIDKITGYARRDLAPLN
jgi:hypothetical protein